MRYRMIRDQVFLCELLFALCGLWAKISLPDRG